MNKTIVFTGSGSHDNDSQDGGYTEKWEWSLSVDNSIWQTMGTTTSILYNYVFTTADTFFIRVRFCDNDNQWGSYYTFTIEIIDCKRYYYVKDHLGNIRQTVDENGVIISAQDYSPYGEIIRSYNNADANDKYKFTEKERDKETNLDYFGARYYDAELGIWLSTDPLEELYRGWSPYNYVLDNPLRLIDPNGMEAAQAEPDEKSKRKTHQEMTFALFHPFAAQDIGSYQDYGTNISSQAGNFASNSGLTSGEGGQANALRHVIWQAIITKEYGKETALQVGFAHEGMMGDYLQKGENIISDKYQFSTLKDADESVDLRNNIIGRNIGEGSKNLSNKMIAIKCLTEFREKGLWVVGANNTIGKQKLTSEEYHSARSNILKLYKTGIRQDSFDRLPSMIKSMHQNN